MSDNKTVREGGDRAEENVLLQRLAGLPRQRHTHMDLWPQIQARLEPQPGQVASPVGSRRWLNGVAAAFALADSSGKLPDRLAIEG